jgi:hypothetical protein
MTDARVATEATKQHFMFSVANMPQPMKHGTKESNDSKSGLANKRQIQQ